MIVTCPSSLTLIAQGSLIPGSESHVNRHRRELRAFFERQRSTVLPEGATVIGSLSLERWNRDLQQVLVDLAVPTIQAFGQEIADRYGVTINARDLAPFLRPYTRITAESTNETTLAQLQDAAITDDPRGAASHVFDVASGSRAAALAESKVTTEANLGRDFGAKSSGLTSKRWVVTSRNPRNTHAAMNGQEVGIAESFSNGAEWPGDPSLPLDERAGCTCLAEFS